MLSACRGSLATSSVQKASALHLLLLSRRWETLPPASPAGSQPWPPCPSASLGHKATFSQHLLTVVSLLRAVEESSGLENPGSLVLALRAGLGTLRSKAGAGLLLAGRERVAPGGFTAVAPGGSRDRAGGHTPKGPPGSGGRRSLFTGLGGIGPLSSDSARHVGCGQKGWHSKWMRRGGLEGWLEL